ncbi:hypothetical protein [Paraburkholderia fynbosensis]|uniref:Uncharacterized protein n=1 Tax=Paraburkholderia fynbosensis TaxID=1200993 RepID=A0A6J5GJE6_9BURK|nr:hypothetical protein [Paraburkholderia fynbosensis]CAB3800568.1 hypothetical protein LMG27177_04872 [Paraburkholderia fynbosensis]
MSLELDLGEPATSSAPVRGSGDACAFEGTVQSAAARAFAEHVQQPARVEHAIVDAAAPTFLSHPLTRHYPRNVAAPRAGELHLWRFRCEWLPVPVQEGDSWLSTTERERARLHPSAALRKRFIGARVVVRWIVGHLFDCEPHAVDLQDDGNEKLQARHPCDGRGVTIDIAYVGIWIVIGMASATLGLSVVVPSPGAASDETPDKSRRRARYGSLCNALRYAPVDIDGDLLSSDIASCAFDLAEHGRWHVLDLPMSGKIRAAVALAQPLMLVRTFGWPKGLALGN